jgi:hypothetical protein
VFSQLSHYPCLKAGANNRIMNSELLKKFGPCGLLCEKCFAYEKGMIKHHAEQLKNCLGEFDNYAKRFVSLLHNPVFEKYPDFKEMLNLLSKGTCKGCRNQECHLFQDCKVRTCYKEKKVEYCFQCTDFPCNNSGFDDNLRLRWEKINRKIKEVGLKNYYDMIKDKPRY